jgi:hypothetical protein
MTKAEIKPAIAAVKELFAQNPDGLKKLVRDARGGDDGRIRGSRSAPDHPYPQEAWDVRAPTVSLKSAELQPDDISPAAVFLASDAANMVSGGAEYEVTGGNSAKDV